MAKKKLNLKDLTTQELEEKLRDDSAHYVKTKFNHTVSPVENPSLIRNMRRDIARMKTELRKRELSKPE
jgi:large subunit ribosomal protein L29